MLIPASRGDAESIEALAAASKLYVPQTVVGEFLVGVLGSDTARARAGERWFDELLTLSTVLSAGLATSRGYARLHRHTRRTGRPIPQNDLWIAATAAEHGLPLLTRDAHFEGLPGVDARLVGPTQTRGSQAARPAAPPASPDHPGA